jgi:hypothetical protein
MHRGEILLCRLLLYAQSGLGGALEAPVVMPAR